VQHILYMEIIGCLSERGFSLDELVVKTKRLFEEKGMSGFIELLLKLVDESLCIGLIRGDGSWKPASCCSNPFYDGHGSRKKEFRTSVGTIKIEWRRLRCKNCGRILIPLREYLGLNAYQSKTSELERIVATIVSDQSYRRSSRHLELIGEIPVPRSTLHRWVMESDCDALDIDGRIVDTLFVDGTGYKRRPSEERSNRGEVRVVLGIGHDGQVMPFGAWSGSSWEEIGKEIRSKRVREGPLADVLVSDGEPGLSEGLSELVNDEQRCHWHTINDLGYVMWRDKAKRNDQRNMQKKMAGIIGIELPEEDFEKVKEEDKEILEKSVNEADTKIDSLIAELMKKGYGHAATYVRKAKDKLFTYVRFFLKYGLVSPRTSSMIERLMREIGRRLKKIAFGWSEKGAAKMARIIIKRITSANEWDEYWKKRLRIDDNVILIYKGVKLQPVPPLLGR
jgi:hypothetical protein